VLGFVIGTKGDAVIPLVLVAVAALLYGRRPPIKPLLAAALVIVFALVPANRAMRAEISAHGRTVTGVAKAVLTPSNYRPDTALRDDLDYVLTRYRQIDDIALINRETPNVYARGNGQLYYQLPLILVIPRAFWPGKPVLDVTSQFSHTYWELPTSISSSTPTTQIGDLIRNFGPPGLLLLIPWGAFLSLCTRYWHRHRSPRGDLVYLTFLAYLATYVESDLPSEIATAGRTLVFGALVAWALLPGGPPGSRPGLRRMRGMLAHRMRLEPQANG
jgi:hypothetical protein